MPTSKHPEEEVDEIYNQIEEFTKELTSKDMLIIMRD